VGQPFRDRWGENGQFIHLDERWHLLVTDRQHNPHLLAQRPPLSNATDWTLWPDSRPLSLPRIPGFNDDKLANAASLFDHRPYDGRWLLTCCIRPAGTYADNYGYRLAMAESTDLHRWNWRNGDR
jgi:hypothetical protein